MSMLQDVFIRGGLHTIGFMPETGYMPDGSEVHSYKGFGGVKVAPSLGAHGIQTPTQANFGKLDFGMSTAGLGFSAISLASGYMTGGIGGLYDATVIELAANTAISAPGVGYVSKTKFAANNTTKVFEARTGKTGLMTRSVGAYVGGTLGQIAGEATGIPMMGTIGAFAGSAVGAAPIRNTAAGLRMMAAHPLMAAGAIGSAVVAGGAITVARAGGTFVKNANKYARARRRMDTDGSLAAFSTNGAYTMRQRAVQAMQKTHMNSRSALGQEANLFHQGATRNYHSRYR